MLRELITWVLNTYLGKYLEDFNPAQLTVALLSGEVELENVPFRKDALRGFGLPLETLSGNIGKIKLQVPVRQFRSAPWCLVIENVYVVIGPKNLENWDEEKEKAADLDYKISQLDNLEAKWRAQREACLESGYYASSYSGWLSYGAGLATNIIENLQLKINNVHIRYEDSVTIPNSRIACGITISSLSAQSCDSNWCPGFTTAWNQNVASFKLVELQSFSFYWDRLTNSKTFGSVPSSDLTIAMQTGCIPKDHRHIINPISAKAHFKRDRSETPLRTRSRPRLSCEVSVNEISLSLTDFQYVQMVECIKGLDNLTKLQTHRLLRPGVPVKNNSRLWWQYAGKCHGFTHETYEQKLQKAKENIKYIKLYSKLILNPNENLTLDEKELKNHVEKERFYDDLRVLREVCFLYSPNNIKLKEQESSQGKGMLYQFFPQWWGWYGNNSSPTSSSPTNSSSPNNVNSNSNESADVVDNISLSKEHSSLEDEILNALEGSVENNSLLKRDAVFGKFDFTLDGGLINIGSEKCTSEEVITMMEMHFDNLKLSVETRPRSGSHLLGLSLGSVCVKDLLTPNTEFPDLIKPQVKEDSFSCYSRYQSQKTKKETLNTTSNEDKEPWFQLQYERKPLVYNTDYRLVVKSKSLDVVYNMEALRWFIDFFSKPLQVFSARQKLEEMTNNTKLKLIKNWKNMLEGDLGQRKSWSLEIDVSAPQIIFVENFSNKNTSIVLIDFGRFQLLKNSTQDKIRQHKCNHKSETNNTIPKDNSLSKLSQRDSEEDDDAFMTPCSTPPGSETSDIDSPTLTLTNKSVTIPELTNVIINEDTGLEDAFHDKIYDKYTIDLTDLQVLVCKGKERWNFASTKGSSALHVLDRFNISLHVERRVVHTIDPEYPALTLYGTLPKLIAHVNEQKIGALCEIVDIISSQKSISNQKLSNSDSIKVENNTSTKGINDPDIITSNDQADITSNEISNLIVLQFVIDQMSLEVQSRGRSIAELQVTGVRAGLNKRSYETNLSLSVHGLLLVDAIQSFGQDFELLVASHRHVGMDSISGSLKQSEPCSPTSPASPDPLQNKRPTSPQTITRAITSLQRANSATWSTLGDLDALITVEVNLITSDNTDENLQIANIHFNNLDIIANQETTVELLGFINRVFPSKNKVKLEDLSKLENKPISKNAELPTSSPLRMEITFDFHRLNVLVLRALMRDSFMVGRKVGTFTMSEARIHATLGSEISVQGSLGGLQILDLTPEGVNHQRILSVGKDPLTEPPDLAQDLMTSLTQEVYGNKNNIFDQRQALSFDVSRNMQSIVDIKIRMASVWYTHCARFMQELSWCATEFKHYLKNFAKSIKDKATDMAYGLVQPTSNDVDSTKNSLAEITIKYSCKDAKKKKSKKVVIRLDVVLDTPVLVVPRSSCSSQVLVAHLGKISITNNQQNINNNYQQKHNNDDDINNFSINDYDNDNIFEMDDDNYDNNDDDDEHFQKKKNTDNFELQQNCDVYNIDVRNMNLFSLDTSRRKGFRLSALPRAEDFYSCQKDAVAILHDTALSLRIIKFFDDKRDIMDKSLQEDLLHVEGSVTQPLQISLSRKQYEQLLETVDNIFKVPPDLMRPPTEVPTTVIESATTKDELDSSFQPGKTFDERSSLGVDSIDRKTALMPRVTFTLPIFIIQLKNEHDNPLIEITFREFNVQYEKQNIYETHIKVSLRSILMEDLLCPRDSKYRQMVVSSAQNTAADRSGTGVSSLSCPDLVRSQMYDEAITGSLPDNLEITAGFDKIQSSISSNVKVQRSRIKLSNLDCPGTPPPSPQPRTVEDNLVIYSATIVDSNCPGLNTQHKSLRQTSSIDFNSLDLIISVERWFLLLNFFGLLSDEDEDRSKVDGHDERYTNEQGKGNTELEITVRSLTLVLVRNEAELAKANVSNAFFIVSQQNVSKIVEGRLGSVSLFDLTTYGRIYRERFLTSGTEALKFIYKRDVEKSNQRTLNKDAKLKIFMSSVRYVHTKRFVMEIQAFIKEFLQLQTPVIRKIKSSDSKYSLQQRPTQLGLEINAGSPIILLPLSFESNQVIVADLGEFSLRNSFHLASEPDVISKKSDTSLLDEILDVMQIDLVNTNLFSGDRLQKNHLTTPTTTTAAATRGSSTSLSRMDTNDDTDIRFDMGSYWIVKKGKNLLKEKCHLKLQIERNMDSWKSHNCPDVSVQGMLSRLHGVLDTEQYKLVRGFLSYNLGEQIDDIYNSNSFSLGESRVNLNVAEPEKRFDKLIWTNMSINIDLEDVSLVLNWIPTDINSTNDYEALACINFIRSCLKIDSFSDGSQDIDLVSQEILVTDSRFNEQDTQKNVFTNILQPIRKQMDNNLVQAEVHSRRRHDHCKFTILLNNMRLMAIIDWIENIQDYLSQNTELPYGSLLRSQNTEISNSQMNLSDDKTPMEVILNITDSELVFVEKTDQIDTNAVILKSTTVVSFKPSDNVKPISVNLNHLEVFSCILGFESETALSIIDPITINLDVKNQAIEIQIQKQFCIRLSYHDVKMFTRMLQSLPKQTRTAQTTTQQRNSPSSSSSSADINKFLVTKLCALGFHKTDCEKALQLCRNQLDEAALWLTQNTEPVNTVTTYEKNKNILEIHSIIIHANCISICVIDDCKDADVPLLELSLSQLEFKQELSKYLFSPQSAFCAMGVSGFCCGRLKAIIASDYYNRHLSGWEPIIESWECDSNWNYSVGQTGTEQSRLNLAICSDKLLKFDITSTLVELWQLVRKNWTQDYYEGCNNTSSSVIQSPSGYKRRSPFIPFSLRNNTGENLWFKILLTSPGGITRTEISGGSGNQWIQVKPNETVPFSFGQQNKLRHLDSHKLNLHQVLVHVDGWSQVGPVSVDKVGVFFRHAHCESTSYSNMPKARIVFAVTLEGSAQKLVTVRSALRVINRLEDVILLKMDHPEHYLGITEWPNAKTAMIKSMENFSIPLSHVHACLYFKPIQSLFSTIDDKNGNKTISNNTNQRRNDNDYWFNQKMNRNSLTGREGRYFQFCDKSITWRDCVDTLEICQEQRLCKGNRDKLYNVLVTTKRDGYPQKEATLLPGHTITLMPPLRINNLLCCDLIYKVTNNAQGRIQASETAYIYEVNLDENINLNITLDGYQVSGQISIPSGHIGTVEPKLRLLDIHNRDLQLRACIQSIKGNGMEISISAPFWLVNKTGLPLVFRQEGVPLAASGQFDENEKARVVSPLMFSFSDPDASPALEVRLGNRYGTSPPWCQSLSLHKDIVHRQLKAANTNETFIIGVEVRRGRGRYSRTSVVTFSPRFQLYNRSSHKLKFAQKCFIMKPSDPDTRKTIIDAVPGCHFPFHWPRSDQEPLLCVKLDDIDNCCWSSGIPINEAQSLYINIRNEHGDMHFLRLEVILQGATYFLLFGDARTLPPPIRLDNYSEVPIKFFQYGCKREWRTTVRPHSSVSYTLDEPIGSQCIQIEAPGGDSFVYSLRDLNMSNTLTYSNFIYIAFKGTFQSPSLCENLHLATEIDIESQHLVLGVKDKRVILMRKLTGDRSQLWLMNSFEQLEHEGSSPPTEPGKKSSNLTPRFVLDIERALNPMDYTPLVVRPTNKQRQLTQTWKFVNNRLMCGHANMCVQARNGVFGLRPGSDAVLGRIDSETHIRSEHSLPIEQHIERQKLRPGSGQLSVTIKMDGPIRTIQIKDVKYQSDLELQPDPLWKHASNMITNNTKQNNSFQDQKVGLVDEYFIKLHLTKGVGISIISKAPFEELAYITLEKIALEVVATPNVRSVDLNVGDMQIDNQLVESPCPILLYTIKTQLPDIRSPSALIFNAKMLPSPNTNAVIFERLIITAHPFALYLEERLVLRAAVFLGLGSSKENATSLADESEYEAQQVATKILAANAKRYYFADFQISPSQIRLSVITASKLSTQLLDLKKKLGLTLIKFEDALIEFDRFTDKHHFETLEIYLRAIKSHYKNQLKWHAASILGSVDFLGNPLGFANDLSEGVSGLLFEGSVKSLVKNVTHGISNSTAKLTETISDGLGRVVLDEQDNETRQKILEVPSGANSSGEHLAAGLKGFGFGLLGGVTSIVKYTYEGAQSDGLHGFISGLGKGIVGTVTKPLIGVLDLASETANAVRETSKSAHRVLPERKRLPRCVSGAPGGLLPSYSHTQAKGQQHLFLINKRNFSEQLMYYEPNLVDDRDGKLRLLISTEYVRIFSRSDEETTIILSHHLSEVLSCHPVTVNRTSDNHKLKKPQFYIEISSSLPHQYKRPRVRCQTEEMAERSSRQINYAKSVYDEREHTLNFDQILED